MSAVAEGTPNVAYMGWLLYNPSTLASLFLPAAGRRHYDYGYLTLDGGGYCWSSSPCSSSYAWYTLIDGNHAGQAYDYRSYAFSVRCVQGLLKEKPIIDLPIVFEPAGQTP
ncbi:hypothetical protein FACS1894159_11460 [Bacteroidia bacterium]|nr:hypothetical protein FACS1894159_11460 [Bacteroidia bacterium]